VNRYHTPLRYPGGKQKLVTFFRELFVANDIVGGEYAEPFAGGAGVAIELLLDGTAGRIHLNDLSKPVYAFWRSLLRAPDDFCRLVSRASLTIDEWRRQREILQRPAAHSQLEVGFATFFLNRVNRSGIIGGGVIGGLDQSGPWKMDARFSRSDLVRRVERIAARRADIRVTRLDGARFLREQVPAMPRNSLVYLDPPYFHRAERLYLNRFSPEDHAALAKTVQGRLRRLWVVSYDDAPAIRALYSKRRRLEYALQYNAARVQQGHELIFVSDELVLPNRSGHRSIDAALRYARRAA